MRGALPLLALSLAAACTQVQVGTNPSLVWSRTPCDRLQGARLVAADGQFLGLVTRSSHRESVLNEFGPYGSEFGETSIWNEHRAYGSDLSPLSPFSMSATRPPRIVSGGDTIAYLTENASLKPRVRPEVLRECTFRGAEDER